MSKKRCKIRKGRIVTVFIIVTAIIILLIGLTKHPKEDKKSSFEVQTEISEVCTSFSPTTNTLPVTNEQAHISTIDDPQCSASVFYSVDDSSYIYSDSINERVAPASLTKLVTAAVALKYADISDIYTVGSEQWLVQPYSSLCYIQIGNELTLYDLISGMLMASGNDAAYTIAVSVARDISSDIYLTDDEAVSYFCGLMNDFAYDLGMTSSNFVNPDGWDDDEQFTTVSDMLKISEYILGLPEIREIVGTYQKSVTIYSGETFIWTNSNLLLDPYSDYYCEYAVGMKTGTTLNAGHNLIAVFQRNDRTYISVVTGCQSDTDRYDLTLKMLSLA